MRHLDIYKGGGHAEEIDGVGHGGISVGFPYLDGVGQGAGTVGCPKGVG